MYWGNVSFLVIGTSNKVLKRSLNFSFSPKGVNKPNKYFLDVVEEQSLQVELLPEAILWASSSFHLASNQAQKLGLVRG